MSTAGRTAFRAAALLAPLSLAACAVGPNYRRPTVADPPAYKELPTVADRSVWQPVTSTDRDRLPIKWWELFGDPELNALEEQLNLSNQNIAAAYQAMLQARALVAEARSGFFPTVSVAPGITGQGPAVGGHTWDVTIPGSVAWTPDLFGGVRRTVEARSANAQASEADLENVALAQRATLAIVYFQLRLQDELEQLYRDTVKAYRESWELAQARYQTGIDTEESVLQAATLLASTEANYADLTITRAQLEHAVAILVGKPPVEVNVAPRTARPRPPGVPIGIPSTLVRRRPDVAAAERAVASANAQIGVAIAAYFPNLNLTARAGAGGFNLANLFSAPLFFWSLGASLVETVFEGGFRSAVVQQSRAAYEQTVANYRQTVLTAFGQVEDDLVALRVLQQELRSQEQAVDAAQRFVKIALDRYRLGVDPYLNVVTAQIALLNNEQAVLRIHLAQLANTVALMQALGGGWESPWIKAEHGARPTPVHP